MNKILKLIVLVLVFIAGTLGAKADAATYYISPTGSDSNQGTIESPWSSLGYAQTRLEPGDILYLRGGIYYESGISLGISGSFTQPIIIQSYTGERAIIDGGVPHFNSAPNSEWELVDQNIHLYRSVRTFGGSYAQAWITEYDCQIIEYGSTSHMESQNYVVSGLNSVYSGPGLQLRSDGHIYIRLELGPYDLYELDGSPINFPANPNPNNHRIALYMSSNLIDLSGASNLVFRNLDFANASRIIEMNSSTHNIEIDGCYFKQGAYGIVTYGASNINIHNSEFNGGIPRYLYWTDLKDSSDPSEAGPEFQTFSVIGEMHNFNIHENMFRNLMDAMIISHGSSDVVVNNNIFKEMHDDTINLNSDVSNIEISHNMMWHVLAGISILGDSGNPGYVYIHHNVIDNSKYQRGGRPVSPKSVWPQWTTGGLFSAHGGVAPSWWVVYNNTFVTRNDGYINHSAGPQTCIGNSNKYVYNNIFVVLHDDLNESPHPFPDRTVFSDDQVSYGSNYDGNVVWRESSIGLPLFSNFGDGGSYNSLEEFRNNSGTNWEIHGIEINPGFNISLIDSTAFDPETIRNRYIPTNNQVFTDGVSYSGFNWPGTDGVDYRGAIPANIAPHTSPAPPKDLRIKE